MQSLDKKYYGLIKEIITKGIEERNERTNSLIKVKLHKLLTYKIGSKITIIGGRKIYPYIAGAELAWACIGTQSTAFISEYSRMWKNFEDEPGIVIPAYGYRWQYKYKRNQIKEAIKALKDDESNRQIWITAWDAQEDGLTNIGLYKNVPCPLGFSLNILNKKINMSVYLRSSDVIVGLPYDIMFYTFLLIAYGESLKKEIGEISFYLNHAHIYEEQYKIAEKIMSNYEEYKKNKKLIQNGYIPQSINKPKYTIEEIIKNPRQYVESLREEAKKCKVKIKGYNPYVEAVI